MAGFRQREGWKFPQTLLPPSADRLWRWAGFFSRTLRNFLGIIIELAAFIFSILCSVAAQGRDQN